MSTVIDELIVLLELDPSQFTEGQRTALASFRQTQEQAVSTAKVIEAQGKKTTEFFTGLKREALGLLAVFLGGRGIKEFVSYVTQLDAAVGRTSTSLGVSTERLSAWQNLAEQTGGSAAGITGTLQGLNREMNQFLLTGQSARLPILRQLGVDIFNANHQLKTADELLLDIIDRTEGMEARRRGSVLSLLGVDEATINAILTMGPAYKELIEQEMKYNVVSEKDVKLAFQRQKSFSSLEQSARSFARTVLNELTPVIIEFFDTLNKQLTDLKSSFDWKTFGQEMRTAFVSLFSDIRDLYSDIQKLRQGDFSPLLGKGGFIAPNSPASEVRDLIFGPPVSSTDQYRRAIGSIESSGKYSAIGPKTSHGTRAYGKYQVMEENIGPWTKEVLGFPMTPQQFVFSPYAQDAVFDKKFGDLVKRYGPQDAASIWFTGKSLSEGGAQRTDITGTSGVDYVNKFNQELRRNRPRLNAGSFGAVPAFPFAGLGGLPLGAPAAATSQGGLGSRTSSTNNHSSEVHVGSIYVTSSKANPKDVAMEIPAAVRRTNFAASVNYSLTG